MRHKYSDLNFVNGEKFYSVFYSSVYYTFWGWNPSILTTVWSRMIIPEPEDRAITFLCPSGNSKLGSSFNFVSFVCHIFVKNVDSGAFTKKITDVSKINMTCCSLSNVFSLFSSSFPFHIASSSLILISTILLSRLVD